MWYYIIRLCIHNIITIIIVTIIIRWWCGCDHDAHMVWMRAHTLTSVYYGNCCHCCHCCCVGAADDPRSRSYNLPVFDSRVRAWTERGLANCWHCSGRVYNIMCHLCVCVRPRALSSVYSRRVPPLVYVRNEREVRDKSIHLSICTYIYIIKCTWYT